MKNDEKLYNFLTLWLLHFDNDDFGGPTDCTVRQRARVPDGFIQRGS